MSYIKRTQLFGKLNSLSYKSIESATAYCKLRGNPCVELEHWFNQIFQLPNSDFHQIAHFFSLDSSRLARDFIEALDRLPNGAISLLDFSISIEEAVETGWLYASLAFNDNKIRSGYLLFGILASNRLRNQLNNISNEFRKVKIDILLEEFQDITKNSPEVDSYAWDGSRLWLATSSISKEHVNKKVVFLSYRRKDSPYATGLLGEFLIA